MATRIAVVYSSSGISNEKYRDLAGRGNHIFFSGQPYEQESFTRGVTVPVEPLGDFLLFLIDMSKQVEPDCSPPVLRRKTPRVLRLTAENPLDAVIARLEQFTSVNLAGKLVERRAADEGKPLLNQTIDSKAIGVAYSMRSALDYIVSTSAEKLNRRVLSLYYGTMALAQAEMLASPSGPSDLDTVEGMTKQGHGLYTFAASNEGFADLRVGVRADGFLPRWMEYLGLDVSGYPKKAAKSQKDIEKMPTGMVCTLGDLFASMPEVYDLYAEVIGAAPKWISVAYDTEDNARTPALNATKRKADSTYGLFIDRSERVPIDSLRSAGWPLAEIQEIQSSDAGITFRARVDHAGYDVWWSVLPVYYSPFRSGPTLLFPTIGGLQDYRAIVGVTLYALSIMARYMPSAWRRIEGGDEDHYLALVKAALTVWERVLPERFLQSVTGERVHSAQPGSWLA